jgi:putative phosphoesterase
MGVCPPGTTWATICSAMTSSSVGAIVVGVLSDTHGHLYAPVIRLLEGVDHVIHAGDIGSLQVLAGLRALAPVTAVRGNCDHYAWAASLPVEAEVELAGVRILVGHIAGSLRERRQGFRVVITGHTHRMASEEREGVLYLNPGSAGPERFGHPRTIARLHITPETPSAQSGAPAQVSVEFLIVPEA